MSLSYTCVEPDQETYGDKTTDTYIKEQKEQWRQQTLLEVENRLRQLNN